MPKENRSQRRRRYHHERNVTKSKTIFKLYKFLEYTAIFLIGALAYYWIEIGFRGHSHWTMAILGGFSTIIVGHLNEGYYSKHVGIVPQMLAGGAIITILELLWGLVLNVWLGLGIWDYSNLPFNFLGQICPQFTAAWVGLSLVIIVVDDLVRKLFFAEPMPKYHLFYCNCEK